MNGRTTRLLATATLAGCTLGGFTLAAAASVGHASPTATTSSFAGKHATFDLQQTPATGQLPRVSDPQAGVAAGSSVQAQAGVAAGSSVRAPAGVAAGSSVQAQAGVPVGSSVQAQTFVAAERAADPSPSPTLGSTTSAPANAPGAGDADPQDYNGAIWAVVAAVIVLLLVGGGTFFLIKTRRMDISQRTTPEDEARSPHQPDATQNESTTKPNRDRS